MPSLIRAGGITWKAGGETWKYEQEVKPGKRIRAGGDTWKAIVNNFVHKFV